jgi:four helix bundle protein
MMAVRGFEELVVWQKAYNLSLEVYALTEEFPAKEQYGLTSQMRRCAVSIVSNIAEGYQRQHTAEYRHFLSISLGGCAELETQVMLSKDLGCITLDNRQNTTGRIEEIGRMIRAMMAKLRP